ncbi:MAG: leucine--tRNA ligase, partial [Bacilli bacterium]
LAEELNEVVLKRSIQLANSDWPTYDESKTKEDNVTIVIQVNGKIREKIDVAIDTPREKLKEMALASEKAKPFITNSIKKVIVVPNKLVNIVC